MHSQGATGIVYFLVECISELTAAFVCVILPSFCMIVPFHRQMFDDTDVICIHFQLYQSLPSSSFISN